MRICLICTELFGYGSFGGYGRATRIIGRELARRGHRVSIVARRLPRTQEERDHFELEGMRVRLYRPSQPWRAIAFLRSCKADIYHSQEASLGTLLAITAKPRARHVVTFRATMDGRDIGIDARADEWGLRDRLMHYVHVDNHLLRAAVRRLPDLYAASDAARQKARARYGWRIDPGFLPTPVVVPDSVAKSSRPTVVFVGRWNRIKQPEHFLALAREFPDVDFIAAGGAPELPEESELRRRYAGLPNLELTGIIDQFSSQRLSEILSKSWILINASLRETLPTSFLEAAAHRCAILSYLDPDGFASRFGCHAADGNLARGLRHLLEGDRWRSLGEAAYDEVKPTYAVDAAIDRHVEAYRRALAPRR